MHVGTGLAVLACSLVQSCFGLDDRGIAARALPSPVTAGASQYFDGIDGPWSSFELLVGTPAQNIRVLIGTSATSTLVVLPEGCQGQPSNCSNARGGLFDNSTSSTWDNIGLYELGIENNLGFTDTGDFGFDTVTLGYQGGGGPAVNHSVVGGIAGTEFYLGLLGLNPRPTNFTTLNDPQPSLLTLLKDQNSIPSLSYSYTAGAPYRLNKALGSLILGGYDASRFQVTNSSYEFDSDQSRDLTVGLADVITNATGSETSLLVSGSISIFIDSSVAEIYLPDDACSAFESAFHLTYDSNAQLYLVNDTLHDELLAKNPFVTLTINTAITGGPGVNFTLPYAAFDLTAESPLVDNTSRYFPLQKATNDTQYTLGRTFLQEAYLIVDYERSNFSVHPNIWNASATSNIITISPTSSPGTPTVSLVSGSGSGSGSGKLSTGAIAGIAVGSAVAVIAIIVALVFFIRRRRKLTRQRQLQAGGLLASKADAERVNEGPKVLSESSGTEQATTEGTVSGDTEVGEDSGPSSNGIETSTEAAELDGEAIHEMPGSPGSPQRIELPTTEMASPLSEATSGSLELRLPPETGFYETPEDLARVSTEAAERRRPSGPA